jgi:hypothetical protein
VFFIFSVAVREKSCDACGDGEYYFRYSFPALHGDGVSEASIAVDRISTGHTLGELKRQDADFLCFSVFSVAVIEKCCDACGDGKYYFRSGFMALHGDGDLEVTTAGDRQSTGHTLLELH